MFWRIQPFCCIPKEVRTREGYEAEQKGLQIVIKSKLMTNTVIFDKILIVSLNNKGRGDVGAWGRGSVTPHQSLENRHTAGKSNTRLREE